MDLTFILCPNIVGLLGLVILLIFTRFNFYLSERKIRLFIAAAIVNLCIILFEVADYLLAEADFASAYLLRRVTSATGFALTPVLPLLLSCIAQKQPLKRAMLVPAGANALLSYASIFTGHMFRIDAENSYARGPLFLVLILISACYLLLMVRISLSNIQEIRASEAVFLRSIVAAIILGNLLEIVFAFHFILWNSCAVLLMSYYLFLHIQYFKYDPLTEVYNRSMFNHEVEGLARKTNVGILSFDLNGLKAINDQQGHAMGDRYITNAAGLINRCFSDAGKLFRVGGDEFVVVIIGTSVKRIREKIDAFEAACREADISVACGYSFIERVTDTAQLLREADKAMYDNKRDRRLNR